MAERKTNNPRKTLADIAKESAKGSNASKRPSSDASSDIHALGAAEETRSHSFSKSISGGFAGSGTLGDGADLSRDLHEGHRAEERKESDSSRLDEIFAIEDGSESQKASETGDDNAPNAENEARKSRKIRSKDDKRVKKEKSRHRWKIFRNVLIIGVVVIVIGAIVAFAAYRWGVCDDANDIEGVWRIEDSEATVTISDDRFILTDDIAYHYEIDPVSKTIELSFGNLNGSARYRFSADRNMLSIEDGSFDGATNLMQDIPWTFDMLFNAMQGNDAKDPKLSEDSMTLRRVQ